MHLFQVQSTKYVLISLNTCRVLENSKEVAFLSMFRMILVCKDKKNGLMYIYLFGEVLTNDVSKVPQFKIPLKRH